MIFEINEEGRGAVRTMAAVAAAVAAVALALRGAGAISLWAMVAGMSVAGLSLLFTALFFRRSERPLVTDPEIAFAPADGRVVLVEEVREDEYFGDRRLQVSIFMSLTDIHSNLYPVGGRVVYFRYHPGRFLVAWHPKSSVYNEHTTTVIDTGGDMVLMRQIAGILARRIVSYPVVGGTAEQNRKMGFIKFGSRVDLLFPAGTEILVQKGARVKGGQTPIARVKNQEINTV